MKNLKKRVFEIFYEICRIPHGSANMRAISDFCVAFAKQNGLRYVQDDALNVIIYKEGTGALKNKEPLILQGHLDMVCQKTDDKEIDFEKDPIKPYTEGDFIKADGTTLGADNGIAAAMIMAILESDSLSHPPIEAVFTTDEEIGMIGAGKLDTSLLKSKRMINLDSEDEDELTVSCAGGCDVRLSVPFKSKLKKGVKASITIKNLLGGHSGVEIDKGRINANILMGRILNHAGESIKLNLVSINGGTKTNAIPKSSRAEVLVEDYNELKNCLSGYIKTIKDEIADRESDVEILVEYIGEGEFLTIDDEGSKKIIYILLTTPDGVVTMSKKIEGLVETSLNLGILKKEEDQVFMQYALRSNKQSSLDFLKEKLMSYAKFLGILAESGGEYSPWEYKENSLLRDVYAKTYKNVTKKEIKAVAIHAGLECAVFTAKIKNLDCIAIGPKMSSVHTTEEKLSISSTERVFGILCKTLNNL